MSKQPTTPTSTETPLSIQSFMIHEGLLDIYLETNNTALFAILRDKKNTQKIIQRSKKPLWQHATPIQIKQLTLKKRILHLVYRNIEQKTVSLQLSINPFLYQHAILQAHPLKKAKKNPVLKPRAQYSWESFATFNPGALYLGGKIHLIYRAIGNNHQGSVFGYAASQDGIHFHERPAQPIFQSSSAFIAYKHLKHSRPPFPYHSGGSHYGCEDPRLTQIDNKIYMTYTTFGHYLPPTVTLTAINVHHFLNQQWRWEPPMILSHTWETHKNWALFPEKINNQYAILHSLSPKVSIYYLEEINFQKQTKIINSEYYPTGKDNHWDNQMRGIGAPPMKTKEGWLVFYHATDRSDPGKYKIGALLLDYQNPHKIRCRLNYPLMEPYEYYECHGFKSHVIYNCGAVHVGDHILLYYGAADSVICVAKIHLETLLTELQYGTPSLKNQSIISKGYIHHATC